MKKSNILQSYLLLLLFVTQTLDTKAQNKVGSVGPEAGVSNIFAGPSFGFLTGATNKVGGNDRVDIENFENTFNGFDFGVTAEMDFLRLITFVQR
jgi:hypothetical protein